MSDSVEGMLHSSSPPSPAHVQHSARFPLRVHSFRHKKYSILKSIDQVSSILGREKKRWAKVSSMLLLISCHGIRDLHAVRSGDLGRRYTLRRGLLPCRLSHPLPNRKVEGYTNLFIERKPGEVKKSLFLLFGTHTAIAALSFGLLGKPYIAVAAILMWGIGDTAAALVGKKYDTHHIQLKRADPHKTWEGSAAMAVSSFLTGFAVLLLTSPLASWKCLLFSLIAAPFSAATELYSHNGNDTASVPIAVAVVLAALCLL